MGNYWSDASNTNFDDFLNMKPLSTDLQEFLLVRVGTRIRTSTRMAVTRSILGWAREHDLYNKETGVIVCDPVIGNLIGYPEGTEISYDQFQQGLTRHFL